MGFDLLFLVQVRGGGGGAYSPCLLLPTKHMYIHDDPIPLCLNLQQVRGVCFRPITCMPLFLIQKLRNQKVSQI
jgi:hypothetical protein